VTRYSPGVADACCLHSKYSISTAAMGGSRICGTVGAAEMSSYDGLEKNSTSAGKRSSQRMKYSDKRVLRIMRGVRTY